VVDRSLQRAGEGESSLLRGPLGLAAEPASTGQLVTLPKLLRLSQARGHLCAGQIFIHEIHVVTSVRVRVRGGGVHQVLPRAVRRSERPGERETGLLREPLGLATGAEHAGQLASRPALLCLTQAGADLRAYQVVVVDVHGWSFDVVVEEMRRMSGWS
jgi:hypothetical protein